MRRSRGSLVGPRAGGHAVLLGCGLDLSLRSMKGFAASLHQPKKVKILLELSEIEARIACLLLPRQKSVYTSVLCALVQILLLEELTVIAAAWQCLVVPARGRQYQVDRAPRADW